MHEMQRCGLLLLMFRGLCICLLDITMSCAKMAELVEMVFVLWTRGAKKPSVRYVGALLGVILGHADLTSIDILD